MHGGATGSGAPAGNRNALKHGCYSREVLEFRRAMRELLRGARELIDVTQHVDRRDPTSVPGPSTTQHEAPSSNQGCGIRSGATAS